MRSRVLSGIQPTAEMHIGNYFGAVKNWVALQETHECMYAVVDLHAITRPFDPVQLKANTERMVIDLLACGIDPNKAILFIQSLVLEHSELCWILSCLTPYGDLRRMTQFKDKLAIAESEDSTQFVSAGIFTYPVLQAADILIYRAQQVPVGKDQEQHLELSRELARRFNNQFGIEFFPEPAPRCESVCSRRRPLKCARRFKPRSNQWSNRSPLPAWHRSTTPSRSRWSLP